jgi:hypothetical protein
MPGPSYNGPSLVDLSIQGLTPILTLTVSMNLT